MGMDVILYARKNKRHDVVDITEDYELYTRYFSETYKRGYWPQIALALIDAMAKYEDVWYSNDHQEFNKDTTERMTPERVKELTETYIQEMKGYHETL